MTGTVTLGDVRDAARRLEGAVVCTPSAVSATLGEVLGCTLVAVSAGNHAQAVARHARLLGIEATIEATIPPGMG